MTPHLQAAVLVAFSLAIRTASVDAEAAGACVDASCEADETGLLQRHSSAESSPRKSDEKVVEPLAGNTSKRWWWDDSSTTVLKYKPKDIQEALVMGTSANIGPNFDTGVMDLTGLWYLKWDAHGSLGVRAYRRFRMEIAVTFAGSTVTGYSAPDKPFTLKLPFMLPKHWAYSDSVLSTNGQMFAHAVSAYHCDQLTFAMENSTHGQVLGIGPWKFLNQDQWSRPTRTEFGTFTYKLSRIVRADGTRTEHYADYRALMKGYNLQVWGDTDQLARCKETAPLSAVCYAFNDLGGRCA